MQNPFSNFIGVLDDKYILEQEIGSGTSSIVYKVIDSFSFKKYATKVFFDDKKIFFKNEIKFNQIISSSENPFFLKYISSSSGYLELNGTSEMKNYIIFNLCSKGELCDYMQCNRAGFNDTNCKIIMYKLIRAIQELHKMGICHKDLKLQNILLDGDNFQIKIGDFGLSFFTEIKNKKISQFGKFGTKEYMAPEIIKGIKYDGEKADIFSLGIILFILRNYHFPFPNARITSSGNPNQKLYKLIKDNQSNYYWNLLENSGIIKGLSPEFKNLFIKMVAFNPDKRPTLEDILQDEWMKEIINLKEEEFKVYEQNLITELKKREGIINKQK